MSCGATSLRMRRPRRVSPPRRLGIATVAVVCVLAAAAARLATPAAAQSSDYYDGTNYYRTIFTSAGGVPVDGPSGKGSFGVVGYGGAIVNGGVVFSDMGGSGSAIRSISKDGVLSTIAGSLAGRGYVDGPPNVAMFRGTPLGNDRANALAFGNGGYYLTDTGNNALRFTNATTLITTTNITSQFLNAPNSLALFSTDGQTSVFISDTGNQRVMYIPSLNGPLTQVPQFTTGTGFEPGSIAVFPALSRTFIVDRTMQIYCWYYAQSDSSSWTVSTPPITNFGRILSQNSIGTQLLYITGSGTTIASLDATASATASPLLVPQTVIDFDRTAIGGDVRLFFQRTPTSWYILSETKFLIVSTVPFPPPDSSSSSSSSSGSSSGSSSSSSGFAERYLGIAAFPTNAFPTSDACLMSQVYYWMRMDAAEAYSTTDYVNEFLEPPANTTVALVDGVHNVSAWCGNITTDRSNDGTIRILDFWGPRGYNRWYTQDHLVNSNWTHTRAFLAGLQSNGWDLGAFCFINCTTTCKTISAPKCPTNGGEPACDGVCKGAIASSVVMAAAGLVLLVLMIVSPANIFTAVVMVPII
ncbi:flagellar glycoprotein-like protein [Novymonas esmeraldas]|uniref:Flagellar glycoprotein-like protein n=1 Tax=Novymonas esmeraldas TaxID=1808958 RepID=A0AAW0EKF1_9TRYP